MISRKTTKEIFAESLHELASQKPVDKITVQNIVDNCDFSVATFYRHFQDKYDLIAWDYAQKRSANIQRLYTEGYTTKQMIVEGLTGLKNHKVYMTNLLKNTSGHESFVRYMVDTNIQLITERIRKVGNFETLPEDLLLFVKIDCYGKIMTLCEWIIEDCSTPVELLADVFMQSMPERLRLYLERE